MSKRLAKALAERARAEKNIESALKKEYPPGAPIRWARNGVHSGSVILNGYIDRIKVRNERTGRELWVYADAVLSD